ncbi:non-ribosomal peptide synthetase, partial [Xenorhabdus vietnamensis]|uniref:non-ribosomal peptide synthetase n=1 Tax=Xenorhabdus vietnamensis TaxID=351656 RepID=UPI00111C2DC7
VGIEGAVSFRQAVEKVDYPLSVMAHEQGDSLVIKLGYGADWMDPPQARRLLNQLERILHSAANDPQQAHTSVSVLSDQERHTLLHTWNQTDAPYPQDKTLHQLFEAQAEKTPDHIALVFEGETLTYRELNERANQLASVIRQNDERNSGQPLQPDTLIALYFDRSIEMVISILAVLKAGGAYVPISPEYPAERTDFILEDTQATLLLTQQRHLDVLSTVTTGLAQKPTLIAADNTQVTAGMPTGNLPAMSGSTDLAYVIYTSGTTGQPKGVMIAHTSLINLVHDQTQKLGFSTDEKLLSVVDYIFDPSVYHLFLTLLNGASLVIPTNWDVKQPEDLSKLIEHYSISHLSAAAGYLTSLGKPEGCNSLKRVITGGETCAHILKDLWGILLINEYGPTECTVVSTNGRPSLSAQYANCIGKAVGNAQLYVLDNHQKLVPMGAPGELYIGGVGLARGYLNRPELTAERFIDNPFVTEADKAKGYTRLYKTGDLVRWLSDGSLEYLGRNDFQVKIRGFRIELGEIENALNALPQVKQAVVIDRERESHPYLAAYVVPADGDRVNADQLIEQLSARLPEYMLPSTFTQIESVPLTINGKLDRRALPEPEWTDSNNYLAPRNALEKQLCEIWQDVLGLKRVGIHDNFFRIGGDSISAIKLTAAMRRECQIDVPLSLLFEHKIIASLAGQLGQLTCEVIPHQEREHYPLSFAQERMLFIERFEQGSSAYHMPHLVKLNEGTDLSVLVRAINAVVERHPVMKSVYQTDSEGNSYQQVLATDIPVQTTILSDEDVWLSAVKTEIATPFDLTTEPSLRLHHYQVADQAYLLLMWHHIAMDGWSIDIFMQELAAAYQSLSESREVSLPPLDITYGDYAHWQRDYLQSEVGEQQRHYWQDTLSGYELLLLPTDKPRPNHVDYTGNNYNFALDEKLSAQLRALAQKQETTLYTVLLAAFYATLSKLSGQTDIVLGTPTDNRHHAQTQSLLGMFVNSLALRAQVTPELSFERLIAHTHDVVTQAKSHQDMPFEQLVDLLNVERDMSRHPIFQVMFSVQNFGNHAETAGSLPLTPVSFNDDLYTPAKHDLSLFLSDGQTCITGIFNFAVSLFDEISIERMAERYQCVLKALVSDTHQRLAELDVLSEQERHTLLYARNQTDVRYPQDQTLHQLLEAQVEKTPDHIALVFGGTTLTYRELNERANQLASVIRQNYEQRCGQSLQPDTLIALYLDRSVEMVISILAVLKAGGAYVPISPEYPAERTQFILEDTQAPLVLTQMQHQEMLSSLISKLTHKPQLVAADDSQITAAMPTDNLASISRSMDLAYVIYTSGTTGKPKGVLQYHQNVVRLFAETQADYQFTQADIWVLYHAYTFDFSVWELWGALIYGGRLIVPTTSLTKDAVAFSHLCKEQGVSVLNQTPEAFYVFSDVVTDRSIELPDLRYVIFGGDKLNPDKLQSWWHVFGEQHPQLINMYGITETTVHVTYKPLNKNEHVSNIGRPINDMLAYVLDDQQKPVPIGAPGELYIGGAGLARGYLNRPELTAERFINNPFATEADKAKGYTRLYKTGDLARWLSDGNLEYLGRNDFQVKIRGFRIELGEIENALNALPQVKQAVVIDRERESHQYLAAYVVPADGNRVDADQLIERLSARLPEYMVPSTFTQIESVPLTINGKLDRRALPEPEWMENSNYLAPRNALEKQLCEIWQDVLGLKRVGIHDNFFRIGGDSISAIKLTAAMRRECQIDVPLSLLFKHKIIASLAGQLGQLTCEVIPHQECEHYPLSFAQERMLFIERFEQGSNAYHMPYLVKLNEDADLSVLVKAINAVVNRHPVMKSVYQTDSDGNSYQQVLATDIPVQITRLADENTLLSVVKAEIATPFDLTTEPSLRLHHYQVADQTYLLLMWHHIAMDGWSIDIFMQELSAAYQSLSESREVSLPLMDITYGDYARWQRDYLQSEVGEQQRRYWQDTLSNYELLILPTDKPRPNHVDYTGRNCNFTLDEKLSAQLKALAQKQETTLYTVLLAAFYATLSKLSGQTDIILGTPTDNRHHAQTQSLLGMFVNSLALRAQVTPELSFEGLIAHTHDVVTQAKSHQDIPFEQLVDLLDVERDMSRHPIFQVMFSVQNFDNHAETAGSLPWTPVSFNDDLYTPAKYDLSLFLSDDQARITGTFNFAVSLFNEASIERMLERYQRVLKAWVSDTHQYLAKIDVLSAQERHTLLHTWNQTDAPYPQDQTLHQLFEAQVEKTPDHIALVFKNEALTYRELNERANQLANAISQDYKQSRGQPLQPDTLIALYLDRSLEMVISILAVLKAGGAYVPISPEYPQERIHFILEDTQATLLLTQQRHVEALSMVTTELPQKPMLIAVDDTQRIAGMPTDNLPSISGSTDLAYVIYTSGTTGKPKGVMVQSNSVIPLFYADEFKHGQSSSVFWTNYVFDVSIYEIFASLLFGGKLFILPNEIQSDSERYFEFITENHIEFSWMPPFMIKDLVQYVLSSRNCPLKRILTGLDKIYRSDALLLTQHNIAVINAYGTTETSIGSVAVYFQPSVEKREILSIGHPIHNEKCYVLNSDMELVPLGTPGELYIGGVGLSRGYLNRPALTAERFIENPFATGEDVAKGYTRLYKTGDLVRWLPDGNLEYLGRNDFQVKIRGFRIELGEIESALVALSGIKQAVVIDREKEGKKYLAAYIVPEPDVVLSKEQLRSLLASKLPDYMIPASFTMIDNIPLTINGKLDRQALPVPEFVTEVDYIAPINELEHKLCQIWEDVLGVARVGINDNFFRIGGDSIVGIQLVSRLRHAGFSVQVKSLFEAPTVAQLASLLSRMASQATVVAEQGRLTGQFDLLPVQQWFFDGDWASPHHWNQAFMVQLPGHITSAELASALVQLASRHDLLRTHFVYTETGYQQRYHAEISPWMAPLQCCDVSECDEHTLHQTLTEWQSDFDYCDGPLWRAGHLTGWSDGSARLFFAFHHLIIDAVSWRIIAD